jgi:hypothetical protein
MGPYGKRQRRRRDAWSHNWCKISENYRSPRLQRRMQSLGEQARGGRSAFVSAVGGRRFASGTRRGTSVLRARIRRGKLPFFFREGRNVHLLSADGRQNWQPQRGARW